MEPIPIRCTSCGHAMKFSPDKAGRKAKCPKCETVFVIPSPEEKAAVAPGGTAEAQTPKPASADDDGGYGVVLDAELEALRQKREEDDKKRIRELKGRKAPKVKRKYKNLPDAEEWDRVKFGLLFIFFGTLVWFFTHALRGLLISIGGADYLDFARLFNNVVEARPDGAFPDPGWFWNLDQFNLLVGMAVGRSMLGFGKFILIVNTLLYLVQLGLWVTGYIICLPVPRRFGTHAQLVTMLSLAGFNFVMYVFFKLLPTLGAYQYYIIQIIIPEVIITNYNMDRIYPFHVMWSTPGGALWETILATFLQFAFYLEPIVGAVFIWSVGMSLKEPPVEDRGHGITQLGFGTIFALVCFYMLSLCGTTPVLITVLRVIYITWYGFLMMFIVRYALALLRTRDALEARINPE